MSPLVSVLIPCFNAAPYIAAALDSVLAQSYRPVEVIVVDDGSTDGSDAVLERYRQIGVKVIRQQNSGASCARNTAFVASQGEHILFLDGDDLIGPDHIHALASRLSDEKRYVVMSPWARFTHDTNNVSFPHRPEYRDATGVEWLVTAWTSPSSMTQCGQFLIPRRLIVAVGGWNERLSLLDDFEFFARLLAASDGIRFAPGAKLFYRESVAESLSGRRSRAAAESECLSRLLGTEHLLAAENSHRTRKACAQALQDFEFGFYPKYPDLCRKIRRRVRELGGIDSEPSGPPNFHALRRWIGWKAARRVQLIVQRLGLYRAILLRRALLRSRK